MGIRVDISTPSSPSLAVPSPHRAIFNIHENGRAGVLSVLILNTALALSVHERAASRASASLTAVESRVASLRARASDMIVVSTSTGSAAHEQEDGCQEHGGPGSPGETKCVAAYIGGEAGVTEAVPGFDENGTFGLC